MSLAPAADAQRTECRKSPSVAARMLRTSARKTINVRLLQLGFSRRELRGLLGCSSSHLNNTIGGVSASAPARKLLEIAIGIPIWSNPQDFEALTRVLRFQAMSSMTPEQVSGRINRKPSK